MDSVNSTYIEIFDNDFQFSRFLVFPVFANFSLIFPIICLIFPITFLSFTHNIISFSSVLELFSPDWLNPSDFTSILSAHSLPLGV